MTAEINHKLTFWFSFGGRRPWRRLALWFSICCLKHVNLKRLAAHWTSMFSRFVHNSIFNFQTHTILLNLLCIANISVEWLCCSHFTFIISVLELYFIYYTLQIDPFISESFVFQNQIFVPSICLGLFEVTLFILIC